MKQVILSADGDSVVYSVPDVVAENLEKYCLYFCTKWIRSDPGAKKYRVERNGTVGFCYDQDDFIDYLNTCLFPNEQSKRIRNLGRTASEEEYPQEYRGMPKFCF